jgi:hypothetical protein
VTVVVLGSWDEEGEGKGEISLEKIVPRSDTLQYMGPMLQSNGQ